MPIANHWDDEIDNVIISRIRGRWNWAEYDAATAEIRVMIETRSGRVDLIRDVLTNLLTLPPGLSDRVSQGLTQMHPRVGIVVIVGNDINRDILDALAVEYPEVKRRYGFAHDYETARRLILQSRKNAGLYGPPPPDGNQN